MKKLIVLITLISTAAFASGGGGKHEVLYPAHQPDATLSTEPDKVTLTQPNYMEKVSEETITLKWNPSKNADGYHVQIATDSNFKWLVKEEHGFKATEISISGLTKDTNYFWRVAAVKSNNKAGYTKSAFAVNSFRKL